MDVEKLIIVGAGDAGREVLQIIKELNSIKEKWDILGFLDDSRTEIFNLTNKEYKIIGTIEDWKPKKNEYFVCAISEPCTRKKVVNLLESKGAQFISIIDPSVRVSDYSSLGKGLVIYGGRIGPNAKIHDFSFVQSTIAHDSVIGPFSTISGGVTLGGHVSVGSETFIASGAVVIPHIRIGNNAYVGAGSVVIRNVKNNSKVFGNPARYMDFE